MGFCQFFPDVRNSLEMVEGKIRGQQVFAHWHFHFAHTQKNTIPQLPGWPSLPQHWPWAPAAAPQGARARGTARTPLLGCPQGRRGWNFQILTTIQNGCICECHSLWISSFPEAANTGGNKAGCRFCKHAVTFRNTSGGFLGCFFPLGTYCHPLKKNRIAYETLLERDNNHVGTSRIE